MIIKSLRIASVIVLLVSLALMPVAACAAAPVTDTLRVGLARNYSNIKQLTISSTSSYYIAVANLTNKIITSPNGESTLIQIDGQRISIKSNGFEPVMVDGSIVIAPDDSASILKIESTGRASRKYRGAIEINIKAGTLRLINVVKLEDYVLGVIPDEMPNSYPYEALKAQAITVRTYALANIGKHKAEGFDIFDTNSDQLYGGALSEKPRCSQAAMETQGIALKCNGQFASVMYCADCGGATRDYSETHPNKKIPYLSFVSEPTDIQHSAWETTVTLQDIQDKLTKAGVKDIENLTDIRITKIGLSGRVQEIETLGNKGTVCITGLQLQNALGLGTLRSLLFNLEVQPDGSVVIRGKGAGHGYGLCQVGSKALAQPPYSYTYSQIIAHYFPGTEMSSISGGTIIASKPTVGKEIKVAKVPPKAEPPLPPQVNAEIKLMIRIKAPGRL